MSPSDEVVYNYTHQYPVEMAGLQNFIVDLYYASPELYSKLPRIDLTDSNILRVFTNDVLTSEELSLIQTTMEAYSG